MPQPGRGDAHGRDMPFHEIMKLILIFIKWQETM